ncbi:MAG: tetratricopeptide repeat protein [Coleofasciculaceae cyanobacterium]
MKNWQFGRNVAYGARKRQLVLVEEEVTALLAPLAFRMHEEKPSGQVTQAEVEEWLTPKMAELQGVDEPEALELVRQFLRKVRETTGLFVERVPDVYGFMHLTFEEYFAARYIADNEIEDIIKIISPYRNQPRWNEPILLALGYLSSDQRRVNRLVEKLFSNLADYQPLIVDKEIRLKNATADNPVLVWYSQPGGEMQESDSFWRDLLFVGQVLAEVKVTPKFCRQQVEKLVLTYLGLEKYYSDESTQQLLRLLQGIEVFNHQVLERLQQAAEDECLSEEQRSEALVAMLYVACGEAGETLTDCVIAIMQQLTPSLFDKIRDLVEELGAEMTPALERSLEYTSLDVNLRQALEFMTGLSYLRSENYDSAITRLEQLIDQCDCYLDGFIRWAIAIAYEKKDDYEQGLQYYQQCSEKLKSFILWRYWGVCHRSHHQYEQSLECFQQALAITRQSNNRKAEADILSNIGISYQDWEKYEEAIAHYQQSRQLYATLDLQQKVANQLYWLAACYRDSKDYTTGFTYLTELGQTVDKADEALDIARAYLEINPLKNLNQAETLAQQSLQTCQEFNRRKLEASAYKLLGEIYLARHQDDAGTRGRGDAERDAQVPCLFSQESDAKATASEFLNNSLQLYQELDLAEKVAEVEQLILDLLPD